MLWDMGIVFFFVSFCLTIANFYIPVVFQDIVSFIDTVHGILFNYIHIPISHHIPPSPHEFAIIQLIGSESDLRKGLKGEKANPVCRFSGQCFFVFCCRFSGALVKGLGSVGYIIPIHSHL